MRKYAKPGQHQQLRGITRERSRPQVSDGGDNRHLSVIGRAERIREQRVIERLAIATLGDWDND